MYTDIIIKEKSVSLGTSNAQYLMALNHITRVPFLPLSTLSPAGSCSFLFYLFRLSSPVLEARRDFAAIYFMRVTSFSALSLPPTIAYLTPAISSEDSPSWCSYAARQRPTQTLVYALTRTYRVCACKLHKEVFVSIVEAAPECSLLHLFRANSPLKTAYASYHRLANRLAFFLMCRGAVLVKRLRVNSVKRAVNSLTGENIPRNSQKRLLSNSPFPSDTWFTWDHAVSEFQEISRI